MNKWIICMLTGMVTASCGGAEMKKAGYEGDDVSGEVVVTREKETKAATLTVETENDWKLYGGPSVDRIDFSTPLLSGKGRAKVAIPIPDSVRSYFEFVTDRGSALVAERHLPMSGGFNFRDIGGLRTTEGRFVKWGTLVRSDELKNLTSDDLKYLSSIPIVSVVDFRSPKEIASSPDRLPASVRYNHAYSISPGDMQEMVEEDFTNINFDSLMVDMNRLLVSDSLCIAQYKHFFTLLQDESNLPLLYHCTAGKDRTGMATALILHSLGVDEETIMEDYMLSKQYVAGKYAEIVERFPTLAPRIERSPRISGGRPSADRAGLWFSG